MGTPVGTDRACAAVYGYLYLCFKGEYYYWEVVVMARKAAIALIGVMLRPFGGALLSTPWVPLGVPP